MILNTDAIFLKMPRRAVFALALFMVVAFGAVEYISGVVLAFDVFYLIPIAIAAWYCSRPLGTVIALCALASWAVGSRVPREFASTPLITVWNVTGEMVFFIVYAQLISALRRHLLRMEELASQDHLTGVANRRSFYKAAERESKRCLRYGMPFTIMYIDIDDFKKVNDTAGHAQGDRLLACVAQTMRANTRATDTVGRIGGDEFIVLLPETDESQARQTVENLGKELAAATGALQHPATFSIGVVTYLKAPLSVEEMLTSVDDVMYHVKRATNNSVQFATWPERKN